MKTLVVGDTHLKQKLVLPRVDALVDWHGAGHVVFLGDYCDEWSSSDGELMDELSFFAGWVGSARAAGLRVDVLLGNHDYQYLLGGEGPGTHGFMMKEVRALLLELDPVIAAAVDGFLLTHAGLTNEWAARYLDGPEDAVQARDQLNALFEGDAPEDLRALFARGAMRGGWDVPGPLWADLSELADDPCVGLDQIVGHTPVYTCGLMPLTDAGGPAGGCKLCACDTFSLTSSLVPIGDGSMVLIDGGRVVVVGGEDDDLEPWDSAVLNWACAAR